jgi:UDP-2,3-diacylglucosamine hydrolase
MGDWLFMADAHLREGDLEQQKRIIRFLESEKMNLETLVILGDLFEFWFGFEPFAFEGYRPLLDKLEELVRMGVHIWYVEGNHDFSLGRYFEETLRAEITGSNAALNLDGKRIYMAHGDLVNQRDRFYRLFRCMLRNALTYWVMRRVGPGVCKGVAHVLSSMSTGKRVRKNFESIEQTFEEFALGKLREGFDVVILAHSHLPQSSSFEIDGRKAHYFNVGDWITHFSFLRYRHDSGFQIEYFQ